jgi:hypothetical protein
VKVVVYFIVVCGSITKRERELVMVCGTGAFPAASGHQKKTFCVEIGRSKTILPEESS